MFGSRESRASARASGLTNRPALRIHEFCGEELSVETDSRGHGYRSSEESVVQPEDGAGEPRDRNTPESDRGSTRYRYFGTDRVFRGARDSRLIAVQQRFIEYASGYARYGI